MFEVLMIITLCLALLILVGVYCVAAISKNQQAEDMDFLNQLFKGQDYCKDGNLQCTAGREDQFN